MMDDLQRDAARLAANIDQAAASGRQLARLLGSFNSDLIAHGFERAEALELTRDFFDALSNRGEEE